MCILMRATVQAYNSAQRAVLPSPLNNNITILKEKKTNGELHFPLTNKRYFLQLVHLIP